MDIQCHHSFSYWRVQARFKRLLTYLPYIWCYDKRQGKKKKKHSSEHLRNISRWIHNLWPLVSLSLQSNKEHTDFSVPAERWRQQTDQLGWYSHHFPLFYQAGALKTECVQLPIFHHWALLITFRVALLGSDMFQTEHEFFSCLIKKKNRLRESLDRFEKSKTLRLCLKNAFREFSSKILFRFSKNLTSSRNSQKTKIHICYLPGGRSVWEKNCARGLEYGPRP